MRATPTTGSGPVRRCRRRPCGTLVRTPRSHTRWTRFSGPVTIVAAVATAPALIVGLGAAAIGLGIAAEAVDPRPCKAERIATTATIGIFSAGVGGGAVAGGASQFGAGIGIFGAVAGGVAGPPCG